MTHIELEMDKFGRVLIPKKVREALNLKAGSKIKAEMQGPQLTLSAQPPRYIIEHGPSGRPVIHFPDAAPWPDDYDPVKEAREERTAQLIDGWEK